MAGGYKELGKKFPFYYKLDGKEVESPIMATSQSRAKLCVKAKHGTGHKIEFVSKNDQSAIYDRFSAAYKY